MSGANSDMRVERRPGTGSFRENADPPMFLSAGAQHPIAAFLRAVHLRRDDQTAVPLPAVVLRECGNRLLDPAKHRQVGVAEHRDVHRRWLALDGVMTE
jgi:hypothetical protein